MTTPVDPVEGGKPETEPTPEAMTRRRRGWAMDLSPLRQPAYRRLFLGIAATMLGQQMTLVAVPYQVYRLTRSSLLVGVTSVVALVPLVVFGLLGGAIADAMDRRRLMLITSTGAAVTSTLLAVQAALPGEGHLVVLWLLTACVSAAADTTAATPARPASPAKAAAGQSAKQDLTRLPANVLFDKTGVFVYAAAAFPADRYLPLM